MRVRQQLSKRLPIHVGQKEVVDALADIDSVAECGLEASLELVAFLEDLAVCVNVERRGGRRLRTCTSLLVIDQPITSTPPHSHIQYHFQGLRLAPWRSQRGQRRLYMVRRGFD